MKTPLCAFLAGMLIFLAAGCSEPGYPLQGQFKNLQQLKPGDPVMMAGIEVGRVEKIMLDPSGAASTVTLRIKRSVSVKIDSVARIGSAASLGKSFVILSGGSPGAPAAVTGAILKTME